MELTSLNQRDDALIAQLPSQCMSFRLGGQAYAVDILSVQELRRYSEPTSLPDVPAYLSGVINLRGAVVPVLDLRVRFNLEPKLDRLTVIIVVAVRGKSVGLVVDEVTSVLMLSTESVRRAPAMARQVDASFILGMIPNGDALVTLLDIDRLVAEELAA
jgi:purine-binding chemotaxis protein CheW